jgi:type III pantothenate kinase
MSKLLLAIDIGNTTIRMGVFNASALIGDWRFSTMKEKTEDEIGGIIVSALSIKGIKVDEIEAVIISCVVPSLTERIKGMCERYIGSIPIEIDPGREEYLPIAYPEPQQIGADRIVNAVAACEKYAPPLIIIDFGTATTFCAISERGEFMGGCIVPGIGISLDALMQRAERILPITWKQPECIIGKSTEDAVRAGIFFGYAALVDGIVKRMREEIGGVPKVIATGGWSTVIQDAAVSIDVIDPHLTLEGLRIIYERKSLGSHPVTV